MLWVQECHMGCIIIYACSFCLVFYNMFRDLTWETSPSNEFITLTLEEEGARRESTTRFHFFNLNELSLLYHNCLLLLFSEMDRAGRRCTNNELWQSTGHDLQQPHYHWEYPRDSNFWQNLVALNSHASVILLSKLILL